MKPVLGFLAGCILTAMVFFLYISDLKSRFGNSANHGQFELKRVTEQRDACQAKFNRSTVRYIQKKNIFGTPFGEPEKAWVVPADVDPKYIGSEVGLFTHYDPSNQMETVKFQAKR